MIRRYCGSPPAERFLLHIRACCPLYIRERTPPGRSELFVASGRKTPESRPSQFGLRGDIGLERREAVDLNAVAVVDPMAWRASTSRRRAISKLNLNNGALHLERANPSSDYRLRRGS